MSTPSPGLGRPGRPAPPPQSPRVKEFQRRSTIVFSCLFIVIGLVMIGVTTVRGGGTGYIIGALFTALGGGRLKLALHRPGGDGPAGPDGS